ncbi:MAG: hypothetical protein Q8J85_07150 [Sulfuricurvum sp.]|nr:hypothetical protein [Sulfuricurvum sp.]MDP3022997.1 hypothetical protein [Sulfuricurvum sp.]
MKFLVIESSFKDKTVFIQFANYGDTVFSLEVKYSKKNDFIIKTNYMNNQYSNKDKKLIKQYIIDNEKYIMYLVNLSMGDEIHYYITNYELLSRFDSTLEVGNKNRIVHLTEDFKSILDVPFEKYINFKG